MEAPKGMETNGDIVDNEIENDIIPPSFLGGVLQNEEKGREGRKGGKIKRNEVEVQEEEEGSTCFCGQCQLAGRKLPSPRSLLTFYGLAILIGGKKYFFGFAKKTGNRLFWPLFKG